MICVKDNEMEKTEKYENVDNKLYRVICDG